MRAQAAPVEVDQFDLAAGALDGLLRRLGRVRDLDVDRRLALLRKRVRALRFTARGM